MDSVKFADLNSASAESGGRPCLMKLGFSGVVNGGIRRSLDLLHQIRQCYGM